MNSNCSTCFNYGTWPDKNANMSEKDIDQETYIRLFLLQKAADLGIHASLDAAAAAANQLLRSLARKGQTISVSEFATQMLQPEGLTAMDFENFARHDVIIQQLVQTIGSSGALGHAAGSGQLSTSASIRNSRRKSFSSPPTII